MNSDEALDSFSRAVEKAVSQRRLGDLRLYSQEIRHMSLELEASRLLLEKLADLRNFTTDAGTHTHIFLITENGTKHIELRNGSKFHGAQLEQTTSPNCDILLQAKRANRATSRAQLCTNMEEIGPQYKEIPSLTA